MIAEGICPRPLRSGRLNGVACLRPDLFQCHDCMLMSLLARTAPSTSAQPANKPHCTLCNKAWPGGRSLPGNPEGGAVGQEGHGHAGQVPFH